MPEMANLLLQGESADLAVKVRENGLPRALSESPGAGVAMVLRDWASAMSNSLCTVTEG
jgi:hypothetical protein